MTKSSSTAVAIYKSAGLVNVHISSRNYAMCLGRDIVSFVARVTSEHADAISEVRNPLLLLDVDVEYGASVKTTPHIPLLSFRLTTCSS